MTQGTGRVIVRTDRAGRVIEVSGIEIGSPQHYLGTTICGLIPQRCKRIVRLIARALDEQQVFTDTMDVRVAGQNYEVRIEIRPAHDLTRRIRHVHVVADWKAVPAGSETGACYAPVAAQA